MLYKISGIFFLIFYCVSLQANISTFASRLLQQTYELHKHESVISHHEWDELHLTKVIDGIDRTKTAFGPGGLSFLLWPIADKDELMRRQTIIRFFVEHEDMLHIAQSLLDEIHTTEKVLLSYWKQYDQLRNDCVPFYYSCEPLKCLNNNWLALEYGIVMHLFSLFKSMVQSLCINGIQEEFLSWIFGTKKDFNLWEGLINGLHAPLRQHSFALYVLRDKDPVFYSLKDYIRSFYNGSLGDRYTILLHGFDCNGRSFFKKTDDNNSVGIGEKVCAFAAACAPTIIGDIKRAGDIYVVFNQISLIMSHLSQLRFRIIMLKRFFNAAERLNRFVQSLKNVLSFEGDLVIPDCFSQFQTDQLLIKHSCIYSRGKVLYMNNYFMNKKNRLLPLMHAIGLFDAYISVAQLYKEYTKVGMPICFAQFVDSTYPVLSYNDTWFLLLSKNNVVTNDFCLNTLNPQYPGKIIITGPNGGGKSVMLKTIGISAVFAQSLTIVLAATGYQTLFNMIKTGFSSTENITAGLSTFMAEKKMMESMRTHIQKSDEKHHTLLLIDEPYKGTVDDESAKRIYDFGLKSAEYHYTLLGIATHVKKPLFLEKDTAGIFANYQVAIYEYAPGYFQRLFKLMRGPALWWFDDEEKRSRFIDWISV